MPELPMRSAFIPPTGRPGGGPAGGDPGGGSKNALLNQFAADATGREVLAGPVEATAIGNILVQALGAGQIRDMAELRSIVASSFSLTRFQPRETAAWDSAYQHWRESLTSVARA